MNVTRATHIGPPTALQIGVLAGAVLRKKMLIGAVVRQLQGVCGADGRVGDDARCGCALSADDACLPATHRRARLVGVSRCRPRAMAGAGYQLPRILDG